MLVPWYELGLKAGKQSPFIQSLIQWASIINDTDYLRIGRNLEALGFANWSLDAIVDMVTAGSGMLETELSRHTFMPEEVESVQYMSNHNLEADRPKL